MLEGIDVRISGQDVGRGTFSHRHAMFINQKTEGVIVPLNDALKADGKLELANSSLSEMAVLGVRIFFFFVMTMPCLIHSQSLNTARVGKGLICYPFGKHK